MMIPCTRAYIGLGSNLRAPVRQIQRALCALRQIRKTVLIHHSHLYRSKPLGAIRQPDFVNAVAALDTRLTAHELLDELQSIERRQGRERDGRRWGPRTLDLDILLFGDERIATERLVVPHPGLPERSFVLVPLREIAPELWSADGEAHFFQKEGFSSELQKLDSLAEGLGIY